ncbi:MAG: hypothetical protein QM831_43755 [Kofleriaceae bacterium]
MSIKHQTEFETIETTNLEETTGGMTARWLINHPYAANAFLAHHPGIDAQFSANHPWAAANIHSIA